jgi:hypothetical protein
MVSIKSLYRPWLISESDDALQDDHFQFAETPDLTPVGGEDDHGPHIVPVHFGGESQPFPIEKGTEIPQDLFQSEQSEDGPAPHNFPVYTGPGEDWFLA